MTDGPTDLIEFNPETHVEVRTDPREWSDSHEFRDLSDIMHLGSIEMVAVMQRLRKAAEEQGTTLGEFKVRWIVDVSANGWKMPEAALPTEDEMHPDLIPGAVEESKRMWESGVRQVDFEGTGRAIVIHVPKHRVVAEMQQRGLLKKRCSKYGNNHSIMGMGVCDECGYSNL